MQVCGAHSPHQTPLAALFSGTIVIAPSASDHEWPCLPLDFVEVAATSVFPLGLLAPAACRVPGGLIKFDLFFSPVKVYHLHLRRLGGLSSVLYGLGESRTASPRVPSCVQSRGRRSRGGGCSSAAGLQGAGIPGSCHAALAPNLPSKSRPSPLPFASLEPGLNCRERNVLIFLLGEVVLARNGLFSGGEHGVRLALFMNRLDRK